jgi:hypothetical protein
MQAAVPPRSDELSPFQLIELHFMPAVEGLWQHIELAAISQRGMHRVRNAPVTE